MLPEVFIDRMKVLLGEEFDQFLACYQDHPQIGLRVNTLKINVGDFHGISPFKLSPIPWTGEGFFLPEGCRPGTHPYHAAGLYYLQEPSAMAVTELLDPQPGERILDLAAAPGGKTTHIASKMKQQGILVANDIHAHRVRDLFNNLERWGAKNTLVLNETPERLADHFGPFFDKVLLDAPCSGEGMFRKDRPATYEWSPSMVESCARRQDILIRHSARLVRPGGRLIYATCTFAPEENEGVIFRFLQAHPDFKIEKIENRAGFSEGVPGWIPEAFELGEGRGVDELACTVRIWPHKVPGEGHFIAVLKRSEDLLSNPTNPNPFQLFPPKGDPLSYYRTFERETLDCDIPIDRFSLHGNHLYRVPVGAPDLQGLRVVHWGWWLGTMKSKRFEPSQAFVMALSPGDIQQVSDFPLEDPSLLGYLRGEVLVEPGEDGWVMVAVDGYPLGWAKRVNNRLKPHFPRWLRLVGGSSW